MEKFYLVSRNHHSGSRTSVSYGTLPALAVDHCGTPLDAISRYTVEELDDCFGDREDWPQQARELVEAGAVEVAEINGGWIDATTLTPDQERQAYIDAILAQDDGYIYAVLTEAEAHDAIREGRTDHRYGQSMDTGAALARWLEVTDSEGHALSLGEEVVQPILNDDYEQVGERRGKIVELTIRGFDSDPPVIEWSDGVRSIEDPDSLTVARYA